jgi:large subunit ribosomal protein L4
MRMAGHLGKPTGAVQNLRVARIDQENNLLFRARSGARSRGRLSDCREIRAVNMATVEIKNLKNEVVGNLDLADAVFAGPINEGLMHLAVKQYRASLRAGTHKTKTRAEVSGSGKKPWKQKGTGRARVGEIRNPLWRKGGIVMGPQPRDYTAPLPRKMFRAALKSALAVKLRDKQLSVVDAFTLESHKTKAFRKRCEAWFRPQDLLVDHQENPNLWLARGI